MMIKRDCGPLVEQPPAFTGEGHSVKVAVVTISYIVMGWVAALLTLWLAPFAGIGVVWKPALIGWVLWTMSGFVDAFFPRGTVPSNK
jgi:hypothetical protein